MLSSKKEKVYVRRKLIILKPEATDINYIVIESLKYIQGRISFRNCKYKFPFLTFRKFVFMPFRFYERLTAVYFLLPSETA